MPTCSTRTACGRRSRRASSRCRRAASGSSPAMSAAGSAPRAGNIRSTGSCCSPRNGCAGRCSWVCDRSEAVLADEHARDNVSDAELALDAEGRFSGAPGQDAGQCRRLYLVRAQPARDLQQCRHPDRRLRHPGGACLGAGGDGQHQRHRALSRRRTARGDLCHRAADRRCGARTRARSGRIARAEPDPAREDPVQDRAGAELRQRRFPGEPEKGAGAGRLGRVCGAARREQEARQIARHRHREPDREGGRRRARNSPRSASTRAATSRC